MTNMAKWLRNKSVLAAAAGFLALGLAGLFSSCGASENKDDDNDKTGSLSFTTDIDPILTASCGGTDCHSSGSSYTQYVGSEENLKAKKTDVKSRLGLAASSPLVMPKTPDAKGAARTISEADKAKIISFLDQ